MVFQHCIRYTAVKYDIKIIKFDKQIWQQSIASKSLDFSAAIRHT